MANCSFNTEAFRKYFAISVILFVFVSLTFFGVYYFSSHRHDHPQNETIEEHFYTQTLDHFNSDPNNHKQFLQRYFLDRTHWKGGESPIFVYLGGALPIDFVVGQVAVLEMSIKKLGALVMYIEHRFYGHSIPYGRPIGDAMADPELRSFADPELRSFLTSGQALEDYEEIIVNLKANLSAIHSPVVLVGSFYGGVLATWFMMAKPDIAIGALASSAPMYYFYGDVLEGKDDFCSVISEDFRGTNPQCHDLISQSWGTIDDIASQPDGLSMLSNTFHTCSPLQSANELKYYLARFYAFAALYTGPYNQLIHTVCDIITSLPDRDIALRIAEAVGAVSYVGSCRNTTDMSQFSKDPNSLIAWSWQQCNEFVFPNDCFNNSMLPEELFQGSQHPTNCEQQFGKPPPSDWIGKQIGGYHLNESLSRISGNIIFSNGMKDPYSNRGVMHNIGRTCVAISTEQGSFQLDLMPEKPDDPKWLIRQRKQEIKLITKWIHEYSQRGD